MHSLDDFDPVGVNENAVTEANSKTSPDLVCGEMALMEAAPVNNQKASALGFDVGAQGLCTAQQGSALFLSAFFDGLIGCGVRDVVVSPGSRSTPLSMVAHASSLNLYVDVDERGAAFFALGLAKASGRPVCLICTSGTAIANYYPAILEAESSRVPLVVLTGDRPPRLQNLGAPQTCDQIKAFGGHVKHFQQMPLPSPTDAAIAFARQMALEAFIHAAGADASSGCAGGAGPVHFNFPFDEPLKPTLDVKGLFTVGRGPLARENAQVVVNSSEIGVIFPVIEPRSVLGGSQMAALRSLMHGKRTVVLAGEGSCTGIEEARELVAWAQQFDLPLLADPLSGLRSIDNPFVIDSFDNVFGRADCLSIECVIRFGRYPVSKRCCTSLNKLRPLQIVVDALETRDFNAATDVFVRCTPIDFVRSFLSENKNVKEKSKSDQQVFARQWSEQNDIEAKRIAETLGINAGFEGAYAEKLMELAPVNSLVFSANSMAIRLLDTFYRKTDKNLTVLCNRGLNGIDGTVSSALGAAQCFNQTTLLTGDLTMLHDLNALALNRELLVHHGGQTASPIIIVLLNNNGGGIFETLPQKSDDSYFERLFLTPQQVDFSHAAQTFDVEYRRAETVTDFADAYQALLGQPGISIIEVPVPLNNLKDRYGKFL